MENIDCTKKDTRHPASVSWYELDGDDYLKIVLFGWMMGYAAQFMTGQFVDATNDLSDAWTIYTGWQNAYQSTPLTIFDIVGDLFEWAFVLALMLVALFLSAACAWITIGAIGRKLSRVFRPTPD